MKQWRRGGWWSVRLPHWRTAQPFWPSQVRSQPRLEVDKAVPQPTHHPRPLYPLPSRDKARSKLARPECKFRYRPLRG
jgi:hypothetical protein